MPTTYGRALYAECEHLLAQMPRGSEARDHSCHQSTERVLGTPRRLGVSSAADTPTTGELYDDAAFYHSLLKELLDTGSTAAVPGSAPKLKHNKRATDNRQSKGRKLSYEVHPKLLNFMFPEAPERPVVLAELFASVFGQKSQQPTTNGTSRAALPSAKAKRGDELDQPVGSLFA